MRSNSIMFSVNSTNVNDFISERIREIFYDLGMNVDQTSHLATMFLNEHTYLDFDYYNKTVVCEIDKVIHNFVFKCESYMGGTPPSDVLASKDRIIQEKDNFINALESEIDSLKLKIASLMEEQKENSDVY